MYYVILNHTTSKPELLTTDLGTVAKFNSSKWARLSGEDALGGNVYEYLILKAVEY